MDSKAAVPDGLRRSLARWERLWGTPGLARTLTVQYSSRLHRSLARSLPARRIIRLNHVLRLPSNSPLLAEVLCHEAAHVAAYDLHGPGCRPHGDEWSRLVTMAGFAPKLRLVVDMHQTRSANRPARPALDYEHRCPVCQAVRFARRPVTRWRCAECVEAGLVGRLRITRRPSRDGGAE